jgi:hypothetical protein
MKNRFLMLLCLVVILGSLAFVGAASAGARYVCYYSGYIGGFPLSTTIYSQLYDGNGTLLQTRSAVAVTDNANFFLPIMMPIDGYEVVTITLPGFGSFTATWYVLYNQLPITDCVGGIYDGRVNSGGEQMAAPVAIYCSPLADGGIDVYDIDPSNSEGTLAFRASGDEVNAALDDAASSGNAVQIASALGDSLWAASNGNLSVIGPDMTVESKTYRFDFAGDTCGSGPLAAQSSSGPSGPVSTYCPPRPPGWGGPWCS